MTSRLLTPAMLAGVLLIGSPARAQQTPIPLSIPENFAAGKTQSVSVKGADAAATLTLSPLSSPSDWNPEASPAPTPLPNGVYGHALVSSGNRTYTVGGQPVRMLYLIGGQRGQIFVPDVLTATVDANGTVSPFTPAANPLPQSRAYHTATVYNNVIYVVGGDTSTTGNIADLVVSKTVLMSVLDANGQPGQWTETTALPEERDTVAVTAAKGTLYAVGGAPVGEFLVGTPNTWAAPIHADGTLGAWATLNITDPASFPKRFGAGAFTLADDLWAAGGIDLNDAEARLFSLTDVRRAPLGPDGAPTQWVAQDNLPIDLGYVHNSTVVAGGRVYLIGGQQNGSPASAVIAGTPNNFGRILPTDWAASQKSLPRALNLTATALAGDTLVTAGGQDVANAERNEVFVNKLTPVVPAAFSPFGSFESGVIDLGSVRSIESFNFTVTPTVPPEAGTAQVEVRMAGADGVFANWTAPTGTSPLAVSQTGRYLQYRLLLGVDPAAAGAGAPEIGNLSVTPGSFVYGDANLDGSVDVLDAIKVLRVVVGIDTATPDEVKAGDVAPKPGTNNAPFGDGTLDVQDAVRILRAIVGLDTLP